MTAATQALNSTTQTTFRARFSTLSIGFLVLGLSALGFLVLYSIGRAHTNETAYVIRQAQWFVLGLTAFFVGARINLHAMRKLVWVIGLAAVAALILVLIPGIGQMVNGARRWINLGYVNLQVSEIAKVALVFVLAHYLAAEQRRMGEFFRGFVLPVAVVGVCFALIILQPDYGTAALCAVVGATMLFLAGGRMRFLIPTGLGGAALFAAAVVYDPVRFRRITAFLDIDANRQDGAYQLWQALLAFGSGGTSGRGLGQGRQQMAFLPEAHTDFIFPIIGEELGLIATMSIAGAFLCIFLIAVWRMRSAQSLYLFLIAVGAMLFIVLQALINMGVATGILPTKGISLPFISYGGSNLVTMFFFAGLLVNCFDEWDRKPGALARERGSH